MVTFGRNVIEIVRDCPLFVHNGPCFVRHGPYPTSPWVRVLYIGPCFEYKYVTSPWVRDSPCFVNDPSAFICFTRRFFCFILFDILGIVVSVESASLFQHYPYL